MQTRTYKDHYKRIVTKTTKFLTINNRKAELSINTSKSDSGTLKTSASIGWPSDDGMSVTHAVFSDYYATVVSSRPARVTEKVNQGQHQEALDKLPEIEAAILAHYKA